MFSPKINKGKQGPVQSPKVYKDPEMDKVVISIVNMALPAGNPNRVIEFGEVLPNNITETPSHPRSVPYDIEGRSSPPQSYTGGGSRSVSFSLSLHRDLFLQSTEQETADYFDRLIYKIRALNYPVYTDSGVIAPKAFLKIGDAIKISGIPRTDITYKRPVANKKPIAIDVTISVVEALEVSWSGDDVVEGVENYVSWGSEELR